MSFYHIGAEALKERLGVKDKRSVMERITEIGAHIYKKGKNMYVLEDEIIKGIQSTDLVGYSTKNPKNEI